MDININNYKDKMKTMKKEITPLERYRNHYYNNSKYRDSCRKNNLRRMNERYNYEKFLKSHDPQIHIYYCSSYLFNPNSKINIASKRILSH